MRFEETQLWEIVIPGHIAYTVWYEKIKHLITGHMVFNDSIKGYWKTTPEDSRVFRIACDEQIIKWICEITAEDFNEDCILCYRISNHCLLGYKE